MSSPALSLPVDLLIIFLLGSSAGAAIALHEWWAVGLAVVAGGVWDVGVARAAARAEDRAVRP